MSRLQPRLAVWKDTVAPSVISVAGDAANGLMGTDIYFPDVEPFASNEVNRKFVTKTKEMFIYTPDKFMAVGAFALQIWAMAANELKTLDKEPLAKRIRGGSFKDTIFGDATFEANGQLKSRIYTFSVQEQKIVVDLNSSN